MNDFKVSHKTGGYRSYIKSTDDEESTLVELVKRTIRTYKSKIWDLEKQVKELNRQVIELKEENLRLSSIICSEKEKTE